MPRNAASSSRLTAPLRSALPLMLLVSALLAARAPASRRDAGSSARDVDATPMSRQAAEPLLAAPSRQPTELALAAAPLPVPFDVGDDYGDPRPGGRRHEGVDIAAPKMTPVFAVADGEVRWVHDAIGANCCAVELLHDNGWRSRYIHLNNDSPGTDDGRGFGLADGLERGSRVLAGQCIGWVGDSGNAEHVGPHLHFELRDECGVPVDPRACLRAACAT